MQQLSKYPHLAAYVANLRKIPGGTMHYGAAPALKRPGVQITLSSFRMGVTPVTWAMWKEYCKATNQKLPPDPGWGYPDDHPVVKVSWRDIMQPGGYCEWASGATGIRLTLPTQARWEYAARGGRDGLNYPWGNDFDRAKLWCISLTVSPAKTMPVRRKTRIWSNGYNLTDMVGNVQQWCLDYYNDNYRPIGKDPFSDKTHSGNARSVGGGYWNLYDPNGFRCASRAWCMEDSNTNDIGFRLVAEA